jgi:hypothetical protein
MDVAAIEMRRPDPVTGDLRRERMTLGVANQHLSKLAPAPNADPTASIAMVYVRNISSPTTRHALHRRVIKRANSRASVAPLQCLRSS